MAMHIWLVTHKRYGADKVVTVAARTAPKALEAAAFVVRKEYYGSPIDVLSVERGVEIARIAK